MDIHFNCIDSLVGSLSCQTTILYVFVVGDLCYIQQIPDLHAASEVVN